MQQRCEPPSPFPQQDCWGTAAKTTRVELSTKKALPSSAAKSDTVTDSWIQPFFLFFKKISACSSYLDKDQRVVYCNRDSTSLTTPDAAMLFFFFFFLLDPYH